MEKIKKEYDECLKNINTEFSGKIQYLENELFKKINEVITLKEEILTTKSEKDEFMKSCKEHKAHITMLQSQNDTLRRRIASGKNNSVSQSTDQSESYE